MSDECKVAIVLLLIFLALTATGCTTNKKEDPYCWKCKGEFFDVENCVWICNKERLH